ncbi:acyl-CoA/acyl-ACP dehydrogenase [Qipengyuania aquimaris]|uniref:acyl-CoA dehydrogenase family protein n=1 Tax=Qipengyuania aquimaris TaxID=255984 RepID=UPI001C93AEC9|nr:acyl-CoA dehydrogenase family protein [Qipengyuania aquimaris]MBY6128248.1 acyl-CoA/acyl-ACP dehydrogenase [Qipengyuania aquimaris]
MDFSFTDEQQMLRDGVGKFLEKNYDFDTRQKLVNSDAPWSADAWQQFAEFGLLALPFSEEQGGLGGSISDCVAFAELFGRHLVIEPYLGSVMLAGSALAQSGHAAGQEWVERIVSGEAVVAFAFEEGHGTASPELVAMTAQGSGDSACLTGEKRLVHAGADADGIVVLARKGEGGPPAFYFVEAGADGLDARAYTTIDGRSAANITFNDVAATELQASEEAVEKIISDAIIVQSAEAVGAMGALVAMTGEYAHTRKQFGVPIATFQAVAHRLADMKIAHTKARATLIYTTALAESGAASPRDIAILKGQVGKLGRAVGEAAIQTHGGVGMTDELNVSHYHKRLLACDTTFGDYAYHFRKVGMG